MDCVTRWIPARLSSQIIGNAGPWCWSPASCALVRPALKMASSVTRDEAGCRPAAGQMIRMPRLAASVTASVRLAAPSFVSSEPT